MADAAKDAPEGTTKKKKRKTRARAEEEVGEAEGKGPDDPVPGESRAKVKKHKKNKKGGSEYPNPEKDESLSEQGRKALSYVISYDASREDPSSGIWKFNKARQNWIMRNICDANAVPDSYFQYALKYVQSIQGGARKSLVNHCQTILAPPPAPTDGAKDTTVESAAAAPTDNDQPKPETVQQPIDVQDEMTQKAKAERARVVAGSLKL
ncbi:hypothetical protein BOTBODRAFT_53355 [Botryobasidium botryosum FD-172 SS1]|uniref:WKF domain-containing protein n=1 Tax=Botryobasidium botryosum (strain FD-172 SS1) TaxID=930990 RepID=A0A067N082_BOTB1|nr:hypothetical protein BOTBODRAFT_53355 [Botryobasidium botryosum FD-172 SS1]